MGNTKKNKEAAKSESANIKKDYEAGILLETSARQPVVSMPVFVLDDEHVVAPTGTTSSPTGSLSIGITGSESFSTGITGSSTGATGSTDATGSSSGATGSSTDVTGATGSVVDLTEASGATGSGQRRRMPIGPIVTGHKYGSASTGPVMHVTERET